MSKRWKLTLGIVGGLGVVVVIIMLSPLGRFIVTGGMMRLKDQPFDQQQWKAVRMGEPAALRARLLMLEDLMENHLKDGIDSVSVKEMLGEPERQAGFSYSLGALTEGMEDIIMIVEFDKKGQMKKLHFKSKDKLDELPAF